MLLTWAGRGKGQLQVQKQALTQRRGAGSEGVQPHISPGATHSEADVHSL